MKSPAQHQDSACRLSGTFLPDEPQPPITNSDVAHSPTWPEVSDAIESVLAGRGLVAHNATVERRVIGDHLPRWAPPMVLDTLKLAKAVWPQLAGGYALDKLVTHAQLDITAVTGHRHRAAWDTWAAWQLLTRLLNESALDWDELVQVAAPVEFIPQAKPEGGLW